MDAVVELVGIWIQKNSYCVSNTFICTISIVRRSRIFLNSCNNILILRHGCCPWCRSIKQWTVFASYIGDIPNSISTRTILQRTTSQSVGVTLYYLLVKITSVRVKSATIGMDTACSILGMTVKFAISTLLCCITTECGIKSTCCEVVCICIPHAWVDVIRYLKTSFLEVGSFLCILCLDGLVRDGINQTCTTDTDGRFQSYSYCTIAGFVWSRTGVEGTFRDRNLRINQIKLLAIRELHGRNLFCFHLVDVLPTHIDLALIDRWQEWRLCLCLRHTCNLSYIATIIAVGTIYRMIYYEQIAVTVTIAGFILCLALAMTIFWVAIKAR